MLWRKVSGVCPVFLFRLSPGHGGREEPGGPPEHSNVTVDGTEHGHDGNGAFPEPGDDDPISSPVGDGTGPLQHHAHQPTRNVQYEHRNDPNDAAPKPKWHEHHTQPGPGTEAACLQPGGRDGERFRSEHVGEFGPNPAAPTDERASRPGLAEVPGPSKASKHYGNSPARSTKLATEEPAGDAWED